MSYTGRIKQLGDGYKTLIKDVANVRATEECEKYVGALKIKLMHDAALSDKKDRADVQSQLNTEEVANMVAEEVRKAYLKAWEE